MWLNATVSQYGLVVPALIGAGFCVCPFLAAVGAAVAIWHSKSRPSWRKNTNATTPDDAHEAASVDFVAHPFVVYRFYLRRLANLKADYS
ncbi:hypothetical protein CMQ_3878 [Grosmannia clavigera kw1407]|uniref:Uncharacterized protein n=1 Tax=Grosmannia clavigera (strain kw1407 / UAMH 11150) TaxID=655863 RepID=F0X9L5_GROCL|nr:uncharacterized protein CMQ_3878 [Grosmannia clavigera kw1407]EFX05809.1 hypothetical protein CMQ_3878 [Grosmannia clavigera kw1407]